MMIARAGCAVSKLSFAATTNFHFKSLPLKTLSVSVGVQERTFCRVNCEKRNMAVQLRESVELTEVEEKIFERLRKVLLHFNLPTQLRVAGGWVRDKLLGKDSSDIDIALDDMLGREFCDKVNEYLANAGEKTQGVGVIQCNPDQSKHLETARMRIYDMWIDFVNLRSETYVEHSRIPHMKFGTAKEDAYRRDLTINSLFYNINTGSVEDLTGRGISDLKAGVIATPLPPKDTFLDDPLRVLRAIRFGARFEFKLDDDLKKAVVDKDVRAALATKISPERIGHEIDLMVSGNQPVKAIGQIEELQLFWTVFCLPQNLEAKLPQDCERACVKSLEALSEVLGKVGFSTLSDDHGRLCLYSALFLPLRNVNYSNRKGKTIPVVSAIIKDSLKLKTKDADMVLSLHDAGEEFTGLIDILISDKHAGNLTPSINEEDDLGISLMSTKCIQTGLLLMKIKELWRAAVFLSTLIKHPVAEYREILDSKEMAEKRASLYISIEKSVLQLGLENVWEMKHLLDGNDIIHELGLKKGGTEVKEWKERIRKWQLANLSGTREECLEWLHQVRAKRLKTDS
ncbi:tRNA nucleotidyltransferase cca2 isoform X1 [Cryptomeria japonica]|uniref:tRNA nucleotidyltransferase cca2 isoform X1 n=1 Tax=Cryptomeria japonica TaxID=3369 RepID=UPI0027DA2E2B|nr:tRNA nucleotidyltransferase cca2 isoform X1 [Cryptomeria japonica]XP_057860452.2 tRNA nucleotidyltransferase cca2 isoform X1 [Cryptomeria japonica]XP_057860453.2 tRNA nucleotidyltransferase cca2 isoform X1 [Cryptomeria japonica]